MSKNLLLENYRQEPGSNMCGPCCVKMILDHYRVDWDLGTIRSACNTLIGGTLESGLVLGLLKAGLKPIFYSFTNGETFYGKYARMESSKVAEDLQKRADKAKGSIRKKCFQEFAEVAKAGALEFKLPTRELIEQELDKGHPWIVGVRAYVIYNWQSSRDAQKGHFVIIQGYNEKSFIINDPVTEGGGTKEVEKDKLLFAMYSMSEGAGICVKGSNE